MRIERDEETPLVQRRRAALLRECILVKCTVSTYVRDNEDRGCRDLYGLPMAYLHATRAITIASL